MRGRAGINDPDYSSQKTISPSAKIRYIACAADTAAATERITRPFCDALRLNSCARDAIFLSCSGSPAGPTQDRSLSQMVAASVSVFLRFLSHLLQLSPRSPPSRLRGNHRDIFSDPISTTCCQQALLPYRVTAFRVRASSGYGACLRPPIPQRNASIPELGHYLSLSPRRDIGAF